MRSETPTQSATDFRDAWRRFKRLRIAWLVVTLGLVLIPLGLEFRMIPVLLSIPHHGIIVPIVLFVPFILITRKLADWVCPRCGRPFEGYGPKLRDWERTWRMLALPRQCVHCGLPKYSFDPMHGLNAPQGP